jgi:hypothetical protein
MSITFSGNANEKLNLTVCNGNAFQLLEELGIEADVCGSIATEELRNRLTATRKISRSEGTNFNYYLDRLEEIVGALEAAGGGRIDWA